jgi:hypothetical protein
MVEVEVEVKVNLRLTVSQPVCPGVRRPFGTRDQFFFLLEISCRQLRLCHFIVPSPTRGRVCNLLAQLLLGLARRTRDQFFFLLEISFRQLRVCYFVAPSLTRGRVCNLLYNCFWVLPEQSLLDRSPAELTAIFYCLVRDSPNLEGQVPVFISPSNRVSQLYPRALGFLFVAPYDSQGLRWRFSNSGHYSSSYLLFKNTTWRRRQNPVSET